jgi:Ca2+-binding EF-hand superfamily protein
MLDSVNAKPHTLRQVSSPASRPRWVRGGLSFAVVAVVLGGAFSAVAADSAAKDDSSSASRESSATIQQGIPPKVRRYAERLLRQYDLNHDGVLQAEEWSKMHGEPQAIDKNGDKLITLEELTDYIAQYGQQRRVSLAMPVIGWTPEPAASGKTTADAAAEEGAVAGEPAEPKAPAAAVPDANRPSGPKPPKETTFYVRPSRIPAGLPDWFTARDLDGDGQLSLSEFAPHPTQADLEDFARYDKNGDGYVTAREYLSVVSPPKPAAKAKDATPGKKGDKKGGKKGSAAAEKSGSEAAKTPADAPAAK